MRLGLLLPFLAERPAGLGTYIEQICSRLVQLNPDVVVYTGTPKAKRDWLSGVEVKAIGSRRLSSLKVAAGPRRRVRRLLWETTEAAWQLPRDGVNVLLSPAQEGPLVGAVPSCIVMHDLTVMRYPEAYDPWSVAHARWLLPRMLRKARKVIAVSENTRRDLMHDLGLSQDHVAVVGEGYDKSVFYPREQAQVDSVRDTYALPPRYLLYAGTYSRHKNLGLIVEAMTRLPKTADDVVLVLLGPKDAGRFAEFTAKVRALGAEHRVKILGYVARDELAALMSGAAAFVFPSRYEGFGLAPLEAMACGAPVVASNVASLPEVVGDGGTLVTGEDPEVWAAAIAAVLRADRSEASSKALAQACRFQWDEAAQKLMEVLKSAAA